MAVYEIVISKFVVARHFKYAAVNQLWEVYMDFHAELFSRMHFMMPSIGMREIAIAHCMSKSILLIPQLPSSVGNDEVA